MNFQVTFLILVLSSLINATQRAKDKFIGEKSSKREEKLFSLFSVVTFKNSGCQSSSGTTGSGINRNGKHLWWLAIFARIGKLSLLFYRNLLHFYRVLKQRWNCLWWLCCRVSWISRFAWIQQSSNSFDCFRFGVCCLFTTQSSGTISENCTYLQNPGFPSAYTTSTTIQWTVTKCSTGLNFAMWFK